MSTTYEALILSEPALIDYWELQEIPTATTSADSQGTHPLTIGGTNPPTLGVTGIPNGGTGYLFNGQGGNTGSYTKSNIMWNIGGTGIAIEAWVYIATNPGEAEWICGIYYSGFLVGDLQIAADRTVFFDNWDNGASGRTINGTVLSLNTWHHLVGTAANSGLMQFYVDTVAQTPQTMAGSVWATNNGSQANSWNIGGATTSGKDAKFVISQVALYNALLTPTQITTHYNTGISGAPAAAPFGAALLAAYG